MEGRSWRQQSPRCLKSPCLVACHCQGPLCHLSDAFRRDCSISEPWGRSEGDKATLEDSSQQGAQVGSSTGRVQGTFGLPRHAEEESSDGGLFPPRLDEMVTAGAGTCLCLASWLFKHTVVTCRRGDKDQIPPAAPKFPGHPPRTLCPPSNPGGLQHVGSGPTRMGSVRLYHPAPTWSLHCTQYGTELQRTASPGPKILQ